VLVLEPEGEVRSTVFYFPGCGSERLFSRVSMAALYVLLEVGARVVLAPPYLCCGFPAHANARTGLHDRTVLRDTILFSQIREMFSYLSFAACAVTCGTCREALEGMEAGKIFGCGITDVARFALEQGLAVQAPGKGRTLYHAPCHDSLDGKAGEVLERIGGYTLDAVPHCCSEAGTLALSRPDISNAMLHRKAAAIRETLQGHAASAGGGSAEAGSARVILTNCPSCLQGLGRSAALGIAPRHVAVELALRLGGEGWVETLRRLASRAQAIHF
jgi:Fe-S oxidoreductase